MFGTKVSEPDLLEITNAIFAFIVKANESRDFLASQTAIQMGASLARSLFL